MNIYKKTARALSWLSLMKILAMSIKIISKLILAWLLSPQDFGIAGVAFIIIVFFERITQTGFRDALIQRKGEINKYLDPAWTIQVIRSFLIFIVVIVLAPYLVKLFNITYEPAYVTMLVRVAVFAQLIAGFNNIAIIALERDLIFNKVFYISLASNLTMNAITIVLAIIFMNVWALIIGQLIGAVFSLIISYIALPYMPKISFDLKRMKDIFQYGKWVFAYTMVIFFSDKLGDVVVTRHLGLLELGLYQMAFFIATLFRDNFVDVMARIIFPLLSKIQHDKQRVAKQFLFSVEIVAFVFLPIGVALCLTSDLVVRSFFDENWYPMIQVLQILAISGTIECVNRNSIQLFKALGKTKIIFYIYCYRFLINLIVVYPLVIKWSVNGVAIAYLISVVVIFIMIKSYAVKLLNYRLYDLIIIYKHTIIACLFLIVFMITFRFYVHLDSSIIMLISVGAVGAAGYLGYLLLIWKKYNTGPIAKIMFFKKGLTC